jgi:arylsulfatase A-like enzyme
VDGLDWDVLLPLVRAGELPTLAGLMQRGVAGELRSMVPTSSPVIWTTIATGKGPRSHGIEGFVYLQATPEGPQPRVYTSGHRRTKAFWNLLSDAGLSVDVIGWWVTYPAEPVEGLMVSQVNTTSAFHAEDEPALLKGALHEGVEAQVWPRQRQAQMLRRARAIDASLDATLRAEYLDPPRPLGPAEQALWESTRWSLRADEVYLAIARARLEERAPAALTAVYLGAPDVVGHRFWRYAYPEDFAEPPAAQQVEALGGLLGRSYRRIDRALADLLARMPADTTVLVVSDHGMQAYDVEGRFEPGTSVVDLLSGHHLDAPPGVLIAAGPGIRGSPPGAGELQREDLARLGSVLDVTPTLLALLDLPVGADMEGAPMTTVIDPAWLAAHPVREVPTHDTPEWLRQRERFQADALDLSERLEQLRALGYVR